MHPYDISPMGNLNPVSSRWPFA